jgi:hypothetical protein
MKWATIRRASRRPASREKGTPVSNHTDDAAIEKNPVEQTEIVRDIARELGDIFVEYVLGQIDFAEVSFATYDVLSDVHAIASGNYELIAHDDDDDDEWDEDDATWDSEQPVDNDGYDDDQHTREQEDLSGEPAR